VVFSTTGSVSSFYGSTVFVSSYFTGSTLVGTAGAFVKLIFSLWISVRNAWERFWMILSSYLLLTPSAAS